MGVMGVRLASPFEMSTLTFPVWVEGLLPLGHGPVLRRKERVIIEYIPTPHSLSGNETHTCKHTFLLHMKLKANPSHRMFLRVRQLRVCSFESITTVTTTRLVMSELWKP